MRNTLAGRWSPPGSILSTRVLGSISMAGTLTRQSSVHPGPDRATTACTVAGTGGKTGVKRAAPVSSAQEPAVPTNSPARANACTGTTARSAGLPTPATTRSPSSQAALSLLRVRPRRECGDGYRRRRSARPRRGRGPAKPSKSPPGNPAPPGGSRRCAGFPGRPVQPAAPGRQWKTPES